MPAKEGRQSRFHIQCPVAGLSRCLWVISVLSHASMVLPEGLTSADKITMPFAACDHRLL